MSTSTNAPSGKAGNDTHDEDRLGDTANKAPAHVEAPESNARISLKQIGVVTAGALLVAGVAVLRRQVKDHAAAARVAQLAYRTYNRSAPSSSYASSTGSASRSTTLSSGTTYDSGLFNSVCREIRNGSIMMTNPGAVGLPIGGGMYWNSNRTISY